MFVGQGCYSQKLRLVGFKFQCNHFPAMKYTIFNNGSRMGILINFINYVRAVNDVIVGNTLSRVHAALTVSLP